MVDVVRDASTFAKLLLRTGKGSAGVQATATDVAVPTNGQGEAPRRTEAEQKLSALLKEMSRLAEDVTPAGEAEYLRVVSEVAKVQAEVAAEQKVGAQGHHG
jgi:hypothetical protein